MQLIHRTARAVIISNSVLLDKKPPRSGERAVRSTYPLKLRTLSAHGRLGDWGICRLWGQGPGDAGLSINVFSETYQLV